MSYLGEAFIRGVGRPGPPAPNGMDLHNPFGQQMWERIHAEIGSGWFLDGFLYLFGEGLDALDPCLEAWSFLLDPGHERMIVGRNAYGALLVVEDAAEQGWVAPVGLLNPLEVHYFRDPELNFSSLIGTWLPERRLPGFHDSSLYDAWNEVTKQRLDLGEGLVIKEPLSLGGTMEAGNFDIEELVPYYRSTGPIYRSALEKKP
ncbi:MAG TPA: hypothetical protein VFE05_21910 [Longimicrobiaceae bacterium]|jgi:hypothetical protein|nr:hypothetical protein [Longimicrobiaceae bacterium]